jgi:formylglycine-generating enzyme required for sulfatase activity
MADIFLSYARQDKDRARLYAQALEAAGWTVFWDPRILPGSSWDEVIEEQLNACRCVVVLWSVTSVKSKWVKAEATEGDNRNILVPVALDTAQPPLQFRGRQSAQLQEWTGDTLHETFRHLLDGISRHVPRPATVSQSRRPASVERLSAPAAALPPSSPASEPPKAASAISPAKPSRPPRVGSVPRFRSDAWSLPDEDDFGFIEVPASTFTMGSDKSKDAQAFDDELPQHQVTLPGFFIARYEVTVGQFKVCTKDGGCTPGEKRALEGPDDLPVRYVSWPEALAYCAWLETKLKAWQGTPRGLADALAGRGGQALRLTLPSEAEWERAARGTDGRVYPCGDRIDLAKANYEAAKRGGPTPVGSFPLGASPVGAMDMSGNVWEWTRSQYQAYPYRADEGRESLKTKDGDPRVVRGGSFDDREGSVRAANRDRSNPGARSYFLGFRVGGLPIQRRVSLMWRVDPKRQRHP